MRRYSAWFVFALLAVVGIVELVRDAPFIPRYAVGIGLLLIGVLAGLRWGADSASYLITDLSRTNSYLAEQNDQLSEMNCELLSRLNDKVEEESRQL